MVEVQPDPDDQHVVYLRGSDATLALSWPEANKLQYDLRQACIAAGITLRGAAGQ